MDQEKFDEKVGEQEVCGCGGNCEVKCDNCTCDSDRKLTDEEKQEVDAVAAVASEFIVKSQETLSEEEVEQVKVASDEFVKKSDSNEDEGHPHQSITIEKPEFDDTDIPSEEIIKQTVTSTTDNGALAVVDVSDEEKRKIFDLKMKQKYADIDWTKVEYDENEDFVLNSEKLLPKLTDEDINVFEAITQGFIDADTIRTWVDLSRSNIAEYIEEYKNNQSMNDEDKEENAKYMESVKETMMESKSMIASIQQESRSIANDFEKDKILNDTVKTVTYNMIMNFIQGKFRYRDVVVTNGQIDPVKLAEMDRYDEISKYLASNLSINTLFKEYSDYSKFKTSSSLLNNRFYTKKVSTGCRAISYTINEFIKLHNGTEGLTKNNISIQDIVNRDICYSNYIVPSISYVALKYGEGKLLKEPTNKEAYDRFVKEITYNNRISEDKFEYLYCSVIRLIERLMNVETLTKMLGFVKLSISTNDGFSSMNNSIIQEGLSFDKDEDYDKIFTYCVKNSPEIVESNMNKWITYYQHLLCIDRATDLINVKEVMADETKSGEEKKSVAFKLLLRIVEHEYRVMYSNIINDLKQYVYSEMTGQYRDLIFRSIIDNLMFQHVIGYKSYDIEGEREEFEGVKLYNYIKEKEPTFYDSCVVNPETDFVLNKINMIDVRNEYNNVLTNSFIRSLEHDLDSIHFNDVTHFISLENREKNAMVNLNKRHSGKKKSRSQRKRHG